MTIFSKKPEETSQPARKTFSEELRGNEIADLRSKARRRLIGASVIALLAVIVLPLIFDGEPVSEQKSTVINLAVGNGGVEEGHGTITIVNNPPAVEPPLNPSAATPPQPSQNSSASTGTPPATNNAAVGTTPPPPTTQGNVPPPTTVRPPVQTTTQPPLVVPAATTTTPAQPPAPQSQPTGAIRLPPPEPPTIAPGTASPTATANNSTVADKNYRLQFGAFSTREKAEEARLNLLMKAQVDAQIESASNGMFRVRSKKLVDKVEAEKMRQDILRNANIESSLVTK